MRNSLLFTKLFAMVTLFALCAAKCGPETSSTPANAETPTSVSQETANTTAEKPSAIPPQAQPEQGTMTVKPTDGGSVKAADRTAKTPPSNTDKASEGIPKEIPIGAAPDQQNTEKMKAEQEKLRKKEEGKKN
jgi:hypothetical protein